MNRRGFLTGVASGALVSPLSAAVGTTKYALTNAAWTDLGVGPMFLSFTGSGVYSIGATSPSLTDEGFSIRRGGSIHLTTTSHVWVRATDASSVSAYTTGAGSVIPGAPVNTAAPVASGTTTVGSTLSCTTGTWTNTPTGYAYQWLQNGANISGATSASYVVVAADAGTSVRCTVTATNAVSSASATSNALSIAALPSAPANTVAPAVSGTATVGSTLSCSTGTWTNSPTGYTYQWLRGGTNISGATSASYVLVAADGGTSVSCRVTATNAAGNTSVASNALAVLGVPANTAAPVASGTLTVGSTLSCTSGTWTNSPTYTYQWQRGGANISGATSASYVTVSADGGTSVGCLVTATNAAGSASQASNTLAIAGGVVTSVWSADDAAANGMTLSNGGLTVTPSGVASWQSIRGSISKSTGKLYVEFINSVNTTGLLGAGTANAAFVSTSYLGSSASSYGGYTNGTNYGTNFTPINGLNVSSPQSGDVIGVAIDFNAGMVWLAENNAWISGGNPATGASPSATFTPATVGALFPAIVFNGAGAGVWTLQATAASQKYAPPSGFSAWDASAPTHSPQALAYLARTVGGNEGGNGTNIANLIDGLVADGVWAKLDALYVLAQQNQTDALLNLVGTSYTATIGGSTPFAAYQGFTGGAGIIDTGFNPATATSPNFTQNSASMGVWVLNSRASGAAYYEIGNNTGVAGAGISPFYNSGGSQTPLNDLTYPAYSGVTNAQGAWSLDRSASASSVYYKNGASVATMAASSTGVASTNVWILGLNNNGTTLDPTSDQVAEAHIGASLGSAGQLALYNRLRTYMTAVGVP